MHDSLPVLAEPEYQFRAISNLVRNAIPYAGAAGRASIRAGGRCVAATGDPPAWRGNPAGGGAIMGTTC